MSISDIAGVSKPDPEKSDSPLDAPAPEAAQPTPQAQPSVASAPSTVSDSTVSEKPTETSTDNSEPQTENSSQQNVTSQDASPVTESTGTSDTNEFLDLLMSKMTNPRDIKRPPIKMMIFADPGVGKTLFLGQIPNNFIIDTEQGSLTLAANKDKIPDSTRMVQYKSFAGLDKIIDTLIEKPEPLQHFEVLTIDSLTTLHKKGLAEVNMREHLKSPSLINEFVPETEHHSENNERIRRMVEKVKNFDGSVILTTHVRTLEKKNQNTKVFPDFSEKLANTLSGMLDVVAYMYIAKIDDEFKRVMMFQPSVEVYAKNRLNLPRNIVDPTWDKIYEALDF